jgi:pimeloyl-ACP methyl ester carboxylesterase
MRCAVVGDPQADSLLFLHGWGLTPRAYLGAVTRLCAAGLQVVAPCLPGFGGSSPLGARAGMSAYADRVAALVDRLELGPAFVAGHSLGGGVALQLATERPDLVRGLVVLNTVGGTPSQTSALAAGSWVRWALRASSELDPRDFLAIAPRLARDFWPSAIRHPVAVTASGVLALVADLSAQAEALAASELPVLFIWSDGDRLVAPGGLGALSGRLGPEVVHGRHGWMLRHPEEFAELLRNALVIHALLERRRRGGDVPIEPHRSRLADLLDPAVALAGPAPTRRTGR